MNQRFCAAAIAAAAFAGSVLFAQEPEPPAVPAARGGRGATDAGTPNPGRGRGPGRSDGFPRFIRPLASQDVLIRGKSLYEANCASCHASDLRGVIGKGVNILRSGVAMSDEHGELIGAKVAAHNPPIRLVDTDLTATSEYIHSILATGGSQGSPPGRNPVGLHLNVLTGDAQAGKVYFDTHCSRCHSVSGDLKGFGAKYDDPRALQNAWVAGSAGGGGFGGRGGGGGGQATVTMPDGEKIQGRLTTETDFLVVLTLADGKHRTIPIDNGVPKVEVTDPQAAHKKMVLELDDPENKNMHDVTAYLATLK